MKGQWEGVEVKWVVFGEVSEGMRQKHRTRERERERERERGTGEVARE